MSTIQLRGEQGSKVESILLKILDWLHVVIKKDPELLESAWKLVHSHLKKYMEDEWLAIVDLAIRGLSEHAITALNKAKATVKRVCKANKKFMEAIKQLGGKYYPGILGATFVGALSGATVGVTGGAVFGGPLGAGLGAAVGVTAGAITGFGAGMSAVYIHWKHKKNKQK